MKFEKNDRFRVKESELEGTVVGTSFNSIYQEDEVYVVWDNFPDKGQCFYSATGLDSMWEKIGKIKDAQVLSSQIQNSDGNDDGMHGYVNQDYLPRGAGPGEFTKEESKKGCEHKRVDAGFTHSKFVCFHCGIDMP